MSAASEPSPTAPDPQARSAELSAAIAGRGHALVAGATMRPLLEARQPLTDWSAFAASWDDMPVDAYMADGGRYRRRRYGVFETADDGTLRSIGPQPHYQSTDYNRLNGGVARWFEPIPEAIAAGATLRATLGFCEALFRQLSPATRRWHVEVHQFRIEALADVAGQPTPEGVHRDGVDYVLVLLVRRRNIASGTTTIHRPDGADLGSFTLTRPFDAVLLDDRRVYHGVTPVQPIDASAPAYRDVLVVTFRALAAA